jgi:predicted CoA-binding protein
MKKERVVILGASDKPDRYSYKAMKRLLEAGHEIVLVNRGYNEIEGHPVQADIGDVTGEVDTLTIYVRPEVSSLLIEPIIKLKPKRVIFNPSTDNVRLQLALDEAGIEWQSACTLVLLRTGQYDAPIPKELPPETSEAAQ